MDGYAESLGGRVEVQVAGLEDRDARCHDGHVEHVHVDDGHHSLCRVASRTPLSWLHTSRRQSYRYSLTEQYTSRSKQGRLKEGQ